MWTQYYKEARVRQNMPAFSVQSYKAGNGRIAKFLKDSNKVDAVHEHGQLKRVADQPDPLEGLKSRFDYDEQFIRDIIYSMTFFLYSYTCTEQPGKAGFAFRH